MKSKDDGILVKIGKIVNLQLMLDTDINTLRSLSVIDLLTIDISIHKIRKSLKSISAILYLYEFQFDHSEFLNLKFNIKSLSKHTAFLRENFVYLQVFNKIEDELKAIDKSDLVELRTQFESKYNLMLPGNIVNEETIEKGNEAIFKITDAIQKLHINSERKLLKRRLSKNYQKTQKLYKKLNLHSSSEQYHQFRKWCKRFYFQKTAFKRLGLEKTSKQNKKLYKLTEYLGNEHDLQLFYHYISVHFTKLSKLTLSFFKRKTNNLRKKILELYPEINY